MKLAVAFGLVVIAACTPHPDEAPVVVSPVASQTIAIVPVKAAPPKIIEGPWSILGDWRGEVSQNDGQRYIVAITFTSDAEGPCATVSYPDVPCSGELFCNTAARGGQVHLTERITENEDKCSARGSISITPIDEHRVRFDYNAYDSYGWVAANGELTR